METVCDSAFQTKSCQIGGGGHRLTRGLSEGAHGCAGHGVEDSELTHPLLLMLLGKLRSTERNQHAKVPW